MIDESTQEILAACPSLDPCDLPLTSADVGDNTYRAGTGSLDGDGNFQPAEELSEPVTVTWNLNSVQLTASATSAEAGTSVNLIATSTVEVSNTPAPLIILDVDTNSEIARCSYDTNCTTDYYGNPGHDHFEAFLGYWDPDNGFSDLISSVSNQVDVTWTLASVALTARTATPFELEGDVTTVATDFSVAGSPFSVILLRDGTAVAWCNYGDSCQSELSFTDTDTHSLLAEVGVVEADGSVTHVQGQSQSLQIAAQPNVITISDPPSDAFANSYLFVSVSTTVELDQTGYSLYIVDMGTGNYSWCEAGSACDTLLSTGETSGTASLEAFIAQGSNRGPYINGDGVAAGLMSNIVPIPISIHAIGGDRSCSDDVIGNDSHTSQTCVSEWFPAGPIADSRPPGQGRRYNAHVTAPKLRMQASPDELGPNEYPTPEQETCDAGQQFVNRF